MSKETTKGGAPGKDPGKAKPKRKLTREEKKQIAAIIRQAKGDGKAHTAQQTIPYINLYPDGICRVTERKYSKSIVFEDINYQLAQADDKTAIFETGATSSTTLTLPYQCSSLSSIKGRSGGSGKGNQHSGAGRCFQLYPHGIRGYAEKPAFQREQRACEAQIYHVQYRSG